MEPKDNIRPNHGIDELNKKLYERDSGDFQIRRSKLTPFYKTVNKIWEEPTTSISPKKISSLWLKILLLSFSFFLVALGLAWFVFSNGTNVVSDENIDIVVNGPVSLKAGDELDLHISLTNKNITGIDQVEMTTVWPDGSRDSENIAKETTYVVEKIGQIKAGETVNVVAKAIVYGKENDELEIKINLGYHLVGSNTIFEKEAVYRIKINASPIDLEVIIPPEINSNQELNLSLKILANTDKPLNNILLEVVYPSGFQFKSASVPPTYDSQKWLLGDLLPGVERVINIKGVIEGQSEELKSFQVKVGIKDLNQEQSIAVLYNDFFKTIEIKKPFLGLTFIENGTTNSIPFTIKSTKRGLYFIEWVNNLPVKVKDLRITARLTGEVLDKNSVNGGTGYYSSVDNTIVWDKHTSSEFESVDPGDTGRLDLSFSTLPYSENSNNVKTPKVYVDLSVAGLRVSEDFANEKIQTDLSRTIVVDSTVLFDAKTFYRDGPLINTGPLPPKVDHPTTYTLTWSLQNTTNDLKNSVIETVLPLGVEWVGVTSPTNEIVEYDSDRHRVVWNLDFIKAGTGTTLPRRTASFQVSLTPSINQFNKAVDLTGGIDFRGIDTFTGSSFLIQQKALTTILSDTGSDKISGFVIK